MRAPFVDFGREVCGDLVAAETREWIVTNGIGGFASGTVAGHLTRRYHGLLIAALRPPLARTLLVSKFDETATYDGKTYPLFANRWRGGVMNPRGYQYIQGFHLEGTSPVWEFGCADALLEKTLWMAQGANVTYVRYRLRRASRRLSLAVKALINYRGFHSLTQAGDWRMEVARVERGLRVVAFKGAVPFFLFGPGCVVETKQEWYRGYELGMERLRGLDCEEDHLHAGTFTAELAPGESLTLVGTTDAQANLDVPSAWERRTNCEQILLAQFSGAHSGTRVPEWVEQLALAADQFVVKRPLANNADAYSVIAGYPWFGDWGRDAMVALPGVTLTTGRLEVARNLLLTWSAFVSRGMLPNRFPESGETPEYNTVDAALWYFLAVSDYWAQTHDLEFLRKVYPALAEIISEYTRGTRYNIHRDPSDGLLYAGEKGQQLTWMDAKIGDSVVTPRAGKPVEVNALWLNALAAMQEFAEAIGSPGSDYKLKAQQALKGFERFWNASQACCFDVLDGPEGHDASLRPNQIFAVALPVSAFDLERQRAIVETVARRLLTSHGLRSLAPDDPRYRGVYLGGPRERDSAYHQGSVWGWLLGPFVEAHLRVWKDPAVAGSFLEPMARQLRTHGLGTASEIFDGAEPFLPRGCIAQAWTVAELLRAWAKVATSSSRTVP